MKPAKRARLEADLAAANQRVHDLRAQLASAIGTAFDALPKAMECHGSAVILTVTALGGREIVPPVAIRDGLSPATVAAIQKDLRRSFELATLVNPAIAAA
jgi:outer membrane protein TolC